LFAQEKPVAFSFTEKTDTVGKHQLVIKALITKGAKLLSTKDIEGLADVKTILNFDSLSKIKLIGNLVALTKPGKEKSAALNNTSIEYCSIAW
jgi:hypothetical protein